MKHSRLGIVFGAGAAAMFWASGVGAQSPAPSKMITESDCTAAKLGDSIPASAIGEPVSAVTLSAPRWNAAGEGWRTLLHGQRLHRAGGSGPERQTDQLPGGASLHVEWSLGAVGRRRNERNYPGARGRAAGAGLRDLWD